MITKSIIASCDQKRCIGKDSDLLFRDRDSLERFKNLTIGCPVIMGRQTHESISKIFLDCTSVIVTQNRDYVPFSTLSYIVESLTTAVSIAEDIAVHDGFDEIYFVGDKQVYSQALSLCSRMYISEFKNDLDEDMFFPEFEKNQWKEVVMFPYETHIFRLLEKISEEQSHQGKNK